ncbi:hypothetical protein DMUE_3451 [Dictyocoela muelleri]|nr:hypothetical protein DMUE_3451 [Dictyocoela muelleri]
MKDFYCQFIDLYCRDFSDEDNPKNIFSVYFWSIVDRVVNKIPKTNNALEGWHRSLNNNFQNAHPNIYEFGMELKKQHAFVENKINQLFLENNDLSYSEFDQLIDKINTYESFPGIQYLKTMSFLLKIKK